MRSMVEREARWWTVRTADPAIPAHSGVSLSTTLRVVPLSQVGEE